MGGLTMDESFYEGWDAIERAWREGLTPDPLLTVSEWADKHRVLSSKAASEPGRWRTSRTPYLREIMDCLSPMSPIERVVLWIGVYEMQHCPDVPWRVVLNECVELAKEFGGTDGHKYVNAVLNGLAPELRALEVQADRAARHPA